MASGLDVLEHLAPAEELCPTHGTLGGAALRLLLPGLVAPFAAPALHIKRLWYTGRGRGRRGGSLPAPPAFIARLAPPTASPQPH